MLFSLKDGSLKDASLLPARHRFEPPGERPGPSSRPIHRSAWKKNSRKFACTGFSEVRLVLLRRVFVLRGVFVLSFVFDDLQALDHLEGEAHHAALLAQVLYVDGLVVVVDKHLVERPGVVVEALGPLGHGLVPYLACLLAHAHASFLRRLHVSRKSVAYFGSGSLGDHYML